MNDKKTIIPLIIGIVLLISIIIVWTVIYSRSPEPYLKETKQYEGFKTNILNQQKNIFQKLISGQKIPFNITKSIDNNYLIDIPSFNDFNFSGKGIVIAGNANKYRYLTGIYTNVYVIRKLYKSNIPIEIFYVGIKESFNSKILSLFEELGNIKIIDLMSVINTNVLKSELIGYQTKPLAVLCSSFKEIILMDADALSFMDPINFFNISGYVESGMVLFRDYVSCLHFINKDFLNNSLNINSDTYCNKTKGYEIDSSCVIINKELCWETIYTISLINVKSDAYYNKYNKNVLGDKDTWLIGCIFTGIDPIISNPKPAVIITDTNLQILGHLQFGEFDYVNVPLYYNNQMIDLEYANTDNWKYTIEINPKKTQLIDNQQMYPITDNMINSFKYAKKAMNILRSNNLLNINIDSNNGIIKKGFIP